MFLQLCRSLEGQGDKGSVGAGVLRYPKALGMSLVGCSIALSKRIGSELIWT